MQIKELKKGDRFRFKGHALMFFGTDIYTYVGYNATTKHHACDNGEKVVYTGSLTQIEKL